jgi:hypothetical protein
LAMSLSGMSLAGRPLSPGSSCLKFKQKVWTFKLSRI